MTNKNKSAHAEKHYVWPHPKFKKSTDKAWLEGRSKNLSGFCTPYNPVISQGHEGTKPVTVTGLPLKVCEFYDTCACTCHQKIDEMYAMMDLSRPEPEQSPEYIIMRDARHAETQAMLDGLGRYAAISGPSSSSVAPNVGATHEGTLAATGDSVTDALAGHARVIPEPTFGPTPTGRRARGQLEYDVLTVCTDYAANVFDWSDCTPKLVSEEIGKRYSIEPPSTGAINAVWNRWEALDFAVQDNKPSRFVNFTGEHTPAHLESIKLRKKRSKKMDQAQQKRGTLRPRGKK